MNKKNINNKMKKQESHISYHTSHNAGITIVALIITIIVLLILAVVAIRAVQGEGIIVQATKSAFMSKAKKYEEELNLYINNKVVENINNGFDKSTLFANDITTPSIKEIIKSISKEDETKFVIREGKLEYIGEGTQELEWSKDLGIESKNKLKIYGNSVQDGTPTPDNPVEIQSVGNKVQNILDINEWAETKSSTQYIKVEDNKMYVKGGPLDLESNSKMVEWLKNNIKPDTDYTFNYKKNADSTFIGQIRLYYTIDGTTYRTDIGDTYETLKVFNLSENVLDNLSYIYFYGGNDDTSYIYDVMILEGSYDAQSIPDYEPYGKYKIPIKLTKENGESEIKNIYLDEPLRKVGDYTDYIDFNSGKVVRNIKKYIFNGTESWAGGFTTTNGWGGTNTVGFYQYVKGVNNQYLFGKYYPSKSSSTINNYFAHPKDGTYENDVQGSAYNEGNGNSSYYSMRINRSILEQYGSNNSSLEVNQVAFAAFLKDKYDSGNPVEVQYVLETFIENNITLPQITSLEDYTSIEVLTSIAPSKIEK